MTEIMVSRRDGVVKGPDGVRYRVYRGKTLADARHPIVQAYPGDWQPMEIHLAVDASTASVPQDSTEAAEIDDLREQLAEAEGEADAYRQQLIRLTDGLMARGVKVPPEEERESGWLVDLVLDVVETWRMDNGYPRESAATPTDDDAPAPRPSRTAKRPRAGADD